MIATTELATTLQSLSRILLEIHTQILDVKRRSDPGLRGVPGMNRLIHDPEWAWLRSLSSLIADVDHRTASKEPLTEAEVTDFASRARGTLLGQGDRRTPPSWRSTDRCSRTMPPSRAFTANSSTCSAACPRCPRMNWSARHEPT